MKQSRHLFLNYSFPGRGGRRNQRRATNWRKVGGCTRKTFYSIRRRNIRWDPYLYLEITFFSFFFFSKEAKPRSRNLVCIREQTNPTTFSRPSILSKHIFARHTSSDESMIYVHSSNCETFRLSVRWRSIKKRRCTKRTKRRESVRAVILHG